MKTIFLGLFLTGILMTDSCSTVKKAEQKELLRLSKRADEAKLFAKRKGYSDDYCFLIDMTIPSGKKRFFVFDMNKKTIVFSGLVAHGSCDQNFLPDPKFSNDPGGGCTSIGKYKVGYSYKGQYGKAYKLFGLDKTNSNAYSRAVVLHGYTCVPDEEIYPGAVCNSLGCTMVSYGFLGKVSNIIDRSDKPIVLWIFT